MVNNVKPYTSKDTIMQAKSLSALLRKIFSTNHTMEVTNSTLHSRSINSLESEDIAAVKTMMAIHSHS